MPHEQKRRATPHLIPVLVLIVLAPAIAEILLGDLLLNASFVPTLLMYLLLYGSGAALIREGVRRLHLGWPSIVVLALAYGVVEEGLILQTLFNPRFPGLATIAAYGRALGVSWFWLIGVLAMHAVWSITLPILLTERLFPSLADRPWLSRLGLGLDGIIYGLTGLVMSHFFTGFTRFSAPPITLLLTALGAVMLVCLALFAAPRLVAPRSKSVPAPFWVGAIVLLAGVLFFGAQQFFPRVPTIPALLPILLYGLLYGGVIILIWRWSATPGWSSQHQLALAAGALLTYMLYGFRLSARGSLVDLIFHSVVCAATTGLLIWTFSRNSHAPSVSPSISQGA